jgi:cytochrome P450
MPTFYISSVSNATHATFWLIRAILSDKETQSKFRNEIKDAESSTDKGAYIKKYDVTILCKNDFLQSLYAETLRMYTANIVLRSPSQRPVKIGKWIVNPGKIIATMSYPMHHDETRYNTGSPPGSRPLHSFWAERFLIPDSEAEAQPTGMKFSTSGLEGTWIPFGGGAYTCPGRYFAKQEMLLTAALLLGNFDIELLGESPKPDWRFFGTGVLGVNGKQIVSIQRKA